MVFGVINHSLASIQEPELKPRGGLGSAARLRAGLNAAFRSHTATVRTGQRDTRSPTDTSQRDKVGKRKVTWRMVRR